MQVYHRNNQYQPRGRTAREESTMSVTSTIAPPARHPFSVERGVEAFAGFMILLSVALTHYVHPGFVWLTVFVGANLFQQAFTGFCPAAFLMRRLGLKREAEIATERR
jgi:hypothetical protein